ncbi:hypothetical protein ACLB1G_14630 [Oxalobacteraceae bacterium A2-2]
MFPWEDPTHDSELPLGKTGSHTEFRELHRWMAIDFITLIIGLVSVAVGFAGIIGMTNPYPWPPPMAAAVPTPPPVLIIIYIQAAPAAK